LLSAFAGLLAQGEEEPGPIGLSGFDFGRIFGGWRLIVIRLIPACVFRSAKLRLVRRERRDIAGKRRPSRGEGEAGWLAAK
jgi:hypothetical protein